MKSKIRMDSQLPLGRLVFSHPQESRDASHMMVYLGKLLSQNVSPFLFHPGFIVEHDMGYIFGHLGSAVPSQIHVHPQPT